MFIRTNEDLILVLSTDGITFKTAYAITCRYLKVRTFARSREELLQYTLAYLERFGHLEQEDRPLFLEQQNENFSINDIYK